MDFDLELRQSIHQLVYSEFIQSLLNILRKLDFTTASTTEDDMVLQYARELGTYSCIVNRWAREKKKEEEDHQVEKIQWLHQIQF